MKGSFRFLHCADLHLGCSFQGITNEDESLGKKLKDSLYGALDNIVSISKEENVDFVIFSGDIFDDVNETPLTRSKFVNAVNRIEVPCYICYGNHDYKGKWKDSIPLPSNAYVFKETITDFEFIKDDVPVARLTGASFSSRHTSSDLTAGVIAIKDIFNIGVFHCNLDTYSQGDDYAPCSLSSLIAKNLDYWALGHIHKGRIVNERPYVVYPGNTQGRKSSETGEKGCYVVTVSDGIVADMKFRRTGDILWSDLEMNITQRTDLNEAVREMCADVPKNSMIKVTVKGRGPLDAAIRLDYNGLRELIESVSKCKVTSLIVESSPDIDFLAREQAGDFVSAIIGYSNKMKYMSKEQLLDIICSTNTAQSIRSRFESYSEEELRKMVTDATYLIIDKMEAKK